jgi:uncharacterized protein with NRDE domain
MLFSVGASWDSWDMAYLLADSRDRFCVRPSRHVQSPENAALILSLLPLRPAPPLHLGAWLNAGRLKINPLLALFPVTYKNYRYV